MTEDQYRHVYTVEVCATRLDDGIPRWAERIVVSSTHLTAWTACRRAVDQERQSARHYHEHIDVLGARFIAYKRHPLGILDKAE